MKKVDTENENKIKSIIAVVAVLLVVILLFVGKYMFPDVDGIVKEMVRTSNDAFSQINDTDIDSARSYREGDKGVVLEYIYSKRGSEKEVDVDVRKKELMTNFKKKGLGKFLAHGIYYLIIYKDYKGQEIFKTKITAESLRE